MNMLPLPSAEYLHECFEITPEGRLVWKPRPRSHFRTEAGFKIFTKLRPGRFAEYVGSAGYYYVRLTTDGVGRNLHASRIIWKMVNGRDPSPTVDHIDRDPANNRPSNLREASWSVNNKNRRAWRVSQHGFGVYETPSGTFVARMRVGEKLMNFGTYRTAGEAAAAIAEVGT